MHDETVAEGYVADEIGDWHMVVLSVYGSQPQANAKNVKA